MRTGWSIVCLAFAALCVSVEARAAAACSAPPSGSGYLDGDSHKSVLVFVHGVLSDPIGAWTFKPKTLAREVFWPCLVRGEQRFKNIDIYLFGYHAGWSSSPDIGDIAERMYRNLHDNGVLAKSHIGFVVHSLGGLVLARMLLDHAKAKNFEGRIRFVQFYGTPGEGSEFADLADRFSTSLQIDAMSLRKAHSGLPTGDFAKVSWSFPRFCAAEGDTMWFPPWLEWRLVVQRQSAGAICGGQVMNDFNEKNHSQLVKPEGPDDFVHGLLHNRLSQCLLPRAEPIAAATVAPEVAQWFKRLSGRMIDLSPSSKEFAGELERARYRWPDQRRQEYIVPRTGTSDLDPGSIVKANPNEFDGVFRDQFLSRARSLEMESSIKLSELHEAVRDHHITDFRDRFVRDQVLRDDDDVLVLRSYGDSRADRMLLLLGRQAGEGGRMVPALKGFLLARDTSHCE